MRNIKIPQSKRLPREISREATNWLSQKSPKEYNLQRNSPKSISSLIWINIGRPLSKVAKDQGSRLQWLSTNNSRTTATPKRRKTNSFCCRIWMGAKDRVSTHSPKWASRAILSRWKLGTRTTWSSMGRLRDTGWAKCDNPVFRLDLPDNMLLDQT